MTVLEFFITVLLSLNAGFVIGAWWVTRHNPIETSTLEEPDHER